MRISDWSSDVCSSDLPQFGPVNFAVSYTPNASAEDVGPTAGTPESDGPRDIVSVGSNLTHEGNGWSLVGSLGGSWVLPDATSHDGASYPARLQVAFGAIPLVVPGEIPQHYPDPSGPA